MPRQFETVSTRYRAPMGRSSSGYLETSMPRFVHLFRVRLDSGGYDDGGAYWGTGPALWCAIDGDGNRQFTRAHRREAAALALGIGADALKQADRAGFCAYGLALIDGRAPMPQGATRGDVVEWLKQSGAAMGQAREVQA